MEMETDAARSAFALFFLRCYARARNEEERKKSAMYVSYGRGEIRLNLGDTPGEILPPSSSSSPRLQRLDG